MVIELRNHPIRVADLVLAWGRPHGASRQREWRAGPAESKSRGMYAHLMDGNREIPGEGRWRPTTGPVGEGQGPYARYAQVFSGKSDEDVVSMKRMNNETEQAGCGARSAESVEKRSSAKGNPGRPPATDTQRSGRASSGLDRVRQAARRDKRQRFTNLMHHIDQELLRQAYRALNPKAAAGVDGVTWAEYGKGLDGRLDRVHEQIQSGRYRMRPSKRVWIPKPGGKQRPLGIAVLEDKIVQQAMVWVLEAIYEEDFQGFSYASRPGRSQHQALDAVSVAIEQRKVNWMLDADIRSFYERIDHGWLMKFVEHRVADPRMLRLIKKVLRAGVSEDGQWSKAVVGTPQGAVLSPLLANIYLHYAVDLWVETWRRTQARKEVYIVRYADDIVMGFQDRHEAQRFQAELRQRLEQFGLELHEGKSRLIEFGRFAIDNRAARGQGKPETFDFLGLTHICTKERKSGRFRLQRKTATQRWRSKAKQVKQALLARRHEPLGQQGKWLGSVVRGHIQYYGVPGNRRALDRFRTQVCRAWMTALRRRSQKARRWTWQTMREWIARWIPSARCVHPYPRERLVV